MHLISRSTVWKVKRSVSPLSYTYIYFVIATSEGGKTLEKCLHHVCILCARRQDCRHQDSQVIKTSSLYPNIAYEQRSSRHEVTM